MLGMLVQFGKHTVVRGLSPDRNVSYLLTRKIEQGCRLNYRVQACSLPCRDVSYQNARILCRYVWRNSVADGKYNNNIVRACTQELRTNYGLLVVA